MTNRVIDFRYAPRTSWTCICRPDDPYKSLVREDGAMLYGFRSFGLDIWRFDRVFEFDIQTDWEPVRVQQSTESARVPVVVTVIEYPKAVLTLRAFGHEHDGGRRTDVVLWSIEAAPGVERFLTRLRITAHAPHQYFAPPTLAPGQRIYMAEAAGREEPEFWESVTRYHVEPVDVEPTGSLALVSAPFGLSTISAHGFTSASGLGTPQFQVSAGQPVRGALFFPQNHEESSEFESRLGRPRPRCRTTLLVGTGIATKSVRSRRRRCTGHVARQRPEHFAGA